MQTFVDDDKSILFCKQYVFNFSVLDFLSSKALVTPSTSVYFWTPGFVVFFAFLVELDNFG